MALKIFEHMHDLLRMSERFIDREGNIFVHAVLEAVESLDPELIGLLMGDALAKERFFIPVAGAMVLNQNALIEFFTMNDYMKNSSYTSYTNKIGLIRKDAFIKKFDDVVLAWPHKECVLEGGMSSEEAKKEEVFYNPILSKEEIDRLFEPKVLTNIKKLSSNGESIPEAITMEDNLILKGNNLLALHSLKKRYAREIKLIYIDPPYNTGNDGFKYNDRFNHSTWLTFMKNRLEVARELLREDGAIFIQIDYKELAYLKVLADEIFIDNFVQLISVKTASPAGFKTVNPGPIDVTEYILFYTKNKKQFNFKKGYVPIKYDENYDLVIQNKEDSPQQWVLKKLVDVIYEENNIQLGNTSQQSNKNAKETWGDFWKVIRYELMAEYALKHADKVVSIRDPHKPTERLKELLETSKENKNQIFIYEKDIQVASDSEESEQSFVINGGVLSFYSNKTKIIDGKNTPTELLTDFWHDISWAGIAKEGNVKLKNGKKPEKLIQRIIELSTEEGDIVLDYHLGSGTTAAVAHKMTRRYIGIEQMDYIETISVERLKKVIEGEQGGISKAVGWSGGGSFVYAELKQIDTFENAEIGRLNENMRYLPIGEIDDEEYGISAEEKRLNKQFYGIGNG